MSTPISRPDRQGVDTQWAGVRQVESDREIDRQLRVEPRLAVGVGDEPERTRRSVEVAAEDRPEQPPADRELPAVTGKGESVGPLFLVDVQERPHRLDHVVGRVARGGPDVDLVEGKLGHRIGEFKTCRVVSSAAKRGPPSSVGRKGRWASLRSTPPYMVCKNLASIPGRLEFPGFAEEVGGDDLARLPRVGRGGDVDDRPVGELGHLPGVVQIVIFAERESAVEDDVFRRVERVRVDQDRRVGLGRERLRAGDDLVPFPADRQLVGDPLEDGVALGVAPEDEVRGGDVGVVDARVVLDASLAVEVPPPVLDGPVCLRS